MNVRPLHDRIIVQRLEEGEQKIGGIIIPDTAKEKPQQGKVIAVGAGKVKDDGNAPAARREGRRHHPVRQVLRPGDQARRRGVPHHARGRSARGSRIEVTRIARGTPHESWSDRNGKADYLRRAVAAGDSARRQPAGRRGEGHARPEGPQRRPRQEVRLAHDHQGRRDGRQGDRPEGPAREHGRADGARGREQDVRHGR